MNEQSYTPKEFCKAERISRGLLYKLWKHGKGPRRYYIGRLPRITEEARLRQVCTQQTLISCGQTCLTPHLVLSPLASMTSLSQRLRSTNQLGRVQGMSGTE